VKRYSFQSNSAIFRIFFTSLLLVLLLLTTLFTKPVSANGLITRYVSTTGSDAGDCTSSDLPCRTIAYAINQYSPLGGDTINIAAGTYYEHNLTPTKSYSFIGAGMNTTVIYGNHENRIFNIQTDNITVSLTDLAIQGGQISGGFGAGINLSAQNSNLSLLRVKVSNNQNQGGFGAGIATWSLSANSTLTMTDCEVSGNVITNSSYHGAGIYLGQHTNANLTNVLISGNATAGYAGAIWAAGDLSITNVTITGNTGKVGGIVTTGGYTFNSLNSTIAGNFLLQDGTVGGIDNNHTAYLKNTIIAGNAGQNCDPSSSWTSQGNNLDSGNTCLFTQITDLHDTDPLLGVLSDNGGLTRTLALAPTSPAIDAGTDTGCPSTDQRGIARPKGIHCDMGAYEAEIPNKFAKSSPANPSTNQPANATLRWAVSAGATKYQYCYDKVDDDVCTWKDNGTASTVTLSGLTANSNYYWHVRAVNANGTTYSNDSPTAFWTFKTGLKPAAFNKSSPASGAINQAINPTLKWTASAGAVRYDYCYDTTNDNTCTAWHSNGTATSKVLSGLTNNKTYYWQVRAVSTFGTTYANGASTAYWSFKTVAKPLAFNKSSPANGASNQPANTTLKWAASTGAIRYEYCIDKTNDNACTSWVSTGTATSKTLSGLTASTTYYWQVRAVNALGTTYANASSTSYWSFKTGGKPAAFNKSSPTNGAASQPANLTLKWAASSGASKYEVCYDTTKDNACSTWVSTGTTASKTLTRLAPNTTYYWQVRAVNSFGTVYANGTSTAYWSFKTGTPPGAFEKISPLNNASNVSTNPTLTWQASPGATRYYYCIDKVNDDTCSQWVYNGKLTSVTLTGLNPAATYYWHVKAYNTFGTVYSNGYSYSWWSFITTDSLEMLIQGNPLDID